MLKMLKMGVLGLALGLAGAVVLPAPDAVASPKAPDSSKCTAGCRAGCYAAYQCSSPNASALCGLGLSACLSNTCGC